MVAWKAAIARVDGPLPVELPTSGFGLVDEGGAGTWLGAGPVSVNILSPSAQDLSIVAGQQVGPGAPPAFSLDIRVNRRPVDHRPFSTPRRTRTSAALFTFTGGSTGSGSAWWDPDSLLPRKSTSITWLYHAERPTRAATSNPADVARMLRSRRDSSQVAKFAALKSAETTRPTSDGARATVVSPWYGL